MGFGFNTALNEAINRGIMYSGIDVALALPTGGLSMLPRVITGGMAAERYYEGMGLLAAYAREKMGNREIAKGMKGIKDKESGKIDLDELNNWLDEQTNSITDKRLGGQFLKFGRVGLAGAAAVFAPMGARSVMHYFGVDKMFGQVEGKIGEKVALLSGKIG